MADERLLSVDEFLLTSIVTVMYDAPAMTAAEIAKRVSNTSVRKINRRSVEAILTPLAGVVAVAGVPPCHVIRLRRRRLLQRNTRWRLVVANAASPPDTSDAPVPAKPYRPTLSEGAAAPLTFREDAPPTTAVGKTA
jgi:hypothetical protein